MTSAALGVLLALGALGGACSSASGSPRGAAGAGGADSGSADADSGGAGADAATSKDAGCVDTGLANGQSCWTACHGSVADICALFAAHGGACAMDWPADPVSFCSVYTPLKGIDFLSTADCGSYRAVQANGVDGGNDYYYDKTTGKLVAVVTHDYNTMTAECRGGPSDFTEPSCDFQQLSCPDGGGAGGAGGTGGAAGTAGGGGADAGQ